MRQVWTDRKMVAAVPQFQNSRYRMRIRIKEVMIVEPYYQMRRLQTTPKYGRNWSRHDKN